MNVHEEQEKLAPELRLTDAADRFVRYGIAGLAAQGDLSRGEASRVLLAAIARWWGIDFQREVDALEE